MRAIACVLCGAGKVVSVARVKTAMLAQLRAPTSRRVICARWVASVQLVSHAMRVPTVWMRLGSLTVALHRMA